MNILAINPSPNVSAAPRITQLPKGYERPLWSVMIPTYNCARYLPETLQSVLCQALEPMQMQIEVIDDCSTLDDPEAVVKELGKGRISFHRKQSNEGATRTFNSCIERSKGHLVHILHGDDKVHLGYYGKITALALQHPQLGLYATRCFFINEKSEVIGVTQRVETLEKPGSSVDSFFYATPVQFAGVTVRREAYEQLGGFRLDLVHAADCEMWSRIISGRGGIVLTEPLASYRHFAANDTGRLAKTAENVRDLCRLNKVFAGTYPEFSSAQGDERARSMAWHQYKQFLHLGDKVAARQNLHMWAQITPRRMDRIEFRTKRILRAFKCRMTTRSLPLAGS